LESLNIVFTGQDQVEVRREPVTPIGSQQLLVQTHCTLISTGTEGICLGRKFAPDTSWDKWVKYPFYPGYSNVGTVLEIGAEVKDFQVGQRVASRSNHRQYVTAHQNDVYSIPDDVSDEAASWLAIASIVQGGARRPKIDMGESVVVIGLGMLGQIVVQYARICGAGEIIVVDTAPKRLEMAASHGATHVLQLPVQNTKDKILEITAGQGADVVFDVTGHAPVFQHAIGLLRRFGRLVILGDTGTPEEQRLTHDVINKNLQILGNHDGNAPSQSSDFARWSKSEMIALFWKFLQRDQMRVEDLITHRYSPEDAPEAYQMLQTRRDEAMGVLFDFRRLEN